MMNKKEKLTAPIGAVFTPLKYAEDTIIYTGLYEKWLKGAVILDPTAGSGNFIESFIKIAFQEKRTITPDLLKNLYAVEMQQDYISQFHTKMKELYSIDFPENNFIRGDFLFKKLTVKADYLIGNPPWLNFCDLEDHYKSKIKHLFLESGLAKNKKELLLGSSRIDIAALIICEAIRKNLKKNGMAYFYLPLSLFLNDGAHKGFRSLLQNKKHFALNYIYDYKDKSIFPDVSTRYGFASFTKGETTSYPIKYSSISESGVWIDSMASPIGDENSPLIIHKTEKKLTLPVIPISAKSRPRQGLNTCGANKLFIFDEKISINENLCLVSGKGNEAILPKDLIYPLIGANQFKEIEKNRYVFLPYNENGKVKTEKELKDYPEAMAYLVKHKDLLSSRKGVLIGNSIKKGLWWSLLGIGPYSFAPWKIVWEAYGKKEFHARLFTSENGKLWQPNQALQAFIPLFSKSEAKLVLKKLKNPLIEEILKNQGMEGTCNWAQPGRMMKFFQIKKTD
ncbi:MAG: hypothetical protein PF518_16570 [Spirochaetaceae bacterium]|jgi:hypothetical protein|nr:hypothetical protein [Spirochaetaceae bacterium]